LSTSLLSTTQSAFTAYLKNKLVKALPLSTDLPGIDGDPSAYFDAVSAKNQGDSAWAKEAREKDEKFGMYLNSLSRSSTAIRSAQERFDKQEIGGDAANNLIEAAGDVLGPYIGQTVSAECICCHI
jgi:cysteinyl-tRNA synthetase